MYIQSQALGGRGKSFQGESFFHAENPPFGAPQLLFEDELKRRKRAAGGRERSSEEECGYQPSASVRLSAKRKEAPRSSSRSRTRAVALSADWTRPVTAASQRVAWDLRYPHRLCRPPPNPETEDPFTKDHRAAGKPGAYTVALAETELDGVWTAARSGRRSSRWWLPGRRDDGHLNRAALVEFSRKVARLATRGAGAPLEAANAFDSPAPD